MAILDDLPGGKVYLDTNVFIYAVEAVAEYSAAVDALFDLMDSGSIVACTSELTLAEVLAKPFEVGRDDIAQVYEAMLRPSSWLSVLPIKRTVLMEAARVQAELRLRLPDAIHVATAIAAGCLTILSNDRRLRVPAGIKLLRLK
jgi:predicted nucleic acid-binding protein